MRTQHAALVGRNPRAVENDHVLESMAAIVDALNPVRNRESAAHSKDLVLQEAA